MSVLHKQYVLDMIKEFRRNWHALCDSERTTVCGADSMLLALQLSIAENNKQNWLQSLTWSCNCILKALFTLKSLRNIVDALLDETDKDVNFIALWKATTHSGEFTVCLSDVLLTWKHLLHDKLNLPVENMEVVDHYKDIRRTYDNFLKNSNMLDLIDVYKKYSVLTSNCGNNANISPYQLRDFLSGRWSAVDDETDLYVPTSPVSKDNQDNEKVKLLVKKIIYSYLKLLVNSKDDLALAHILNIPDRGLGREAFTDLKHAAREKQMSIFLVATSFIRAIELGGKGYAPSPSDPLRTHVKGLSKFINFIDKLDEILGEIPNPSMAGGQLLSVIKMQLIKDQNSRDPFYKAVEEVAQDLDLRIKSIINSQGGDIAASNTDISPARPKSYAINHGTAYCGRDTVKILLVLLDEEAASAPTKNKVELLYDDENTIHHNGTSILTLFRSPIQVNNSLVKPLKERIRNSMEEKITEMKQVLIRSQFSCTYKDDCLISRNTWSNVHSASKPLCVLHMEKELSEGVNSSVGRLTIGTSSGNVHLDRSKNEKVERKSSSQAGNKSSKRKQVDLDDENILCDNGNEPPQHKNVKIPKTSKDLQNKLAGKLARVAKSSKCAAKDKLITGQTKLTQFFRL